jgi:hypothetical protein
MLTLKIIYSANVIMGCWISITSLFFPKSAYKKVFGNAFGYSEIIRLVGALYLPIFLLSLIGLIYPLEMSLLLLYQLIYKITWLILGAIPAVLKNKPIPKVMTAVYVIYLIVLPLIIPWGYIFA